MTDSATIAAGGGWVKQSLSAATTVSGIGLQALTRTIGYQVIEWV